MRGACVSGCSGTGCGAGCRDIYPVSRRQWRAKTWTGRPFRIRQQEELLETGRLVFPLRDRAEILSIKKGALSFQEAEGVITRGLAGLVGLRAASPYSVPWKEEEARAICAAVRGSLAG